MAHVKFYDAVLIQTKLGRTFVVYAPRMTWWKHYTLDQQPGQCGQGITVSGPGVAKGVRTGLLEYGMHLFIFG